MFSSMCSLKSSMSPRSSLANLPSSKRNHLLSTFQKQNQDYYINDNIHIQGFQPSLTNSVAVNPLKSSLGERSGSQESFGKAIRDRFSFQKKEMDSDKLKRFKSSDKMERIGHLQMVQSVDVPSGNTLLCSNSDGKRAKYYVVDSEQHKYSIYCSKCSIMLLQKGYQISEIEQPNPNPKKRTDVTQHRAEVQELTVKLNRLQSDIKSQISGLEHNYFFVTIQESKEKIQQTYNKIIQLIFKMKEADLKELKVAKEEILKQTQAEKKVLLNTSKNIDQIRASLSDLSRRLPLVDQKQYRAQIKEALLAIESNKRYECLEFSIKEQNEERMVERIVEEIKSKLVKVVQFSFDNFKRDWNVEECEHSFSDGVRESFRGFLTGYKGFSVKEEENEESELS